MQESFAHCKHVYSRLVNDENDLVGHIAYSLYKDKKLKLVEQYIEKMNSGNPLDKEHLKSICLSIASNESLLEYKTKALDIFETAYSNLIDEEIANIHETLQTETADIARRVTPNGFWYGVAQSIIGAFGFIFAMGVLYGAIYIYEQNFQDKITKKATKIFKNNDSNSSP